MAAEEDGCVVLKLREFSAPITLEPTTSVISSTSKELLAQLHTHDGSISFARMSSSGIELLGEPLGPFPTSASTSGRPVVFWMAISNVEICFFNSASDSLKAMVIPRRQSEPIQPQENLGLPLMKVSFYNMETSIAMDLGLAVFTAALGEQFPNLPKFSTLTLLGCWNSSIIVLFDAHSVAEVAVAANGFFIRHYYLLPEQLRIHGKSKEDPPLLNSIFFQAGSLCWFDASVTDSSLLFHNWKLEDLEESVVMVPPPFPPPLPVPPEEQYRFCDVTSDLQYLVLASDSAKVSLIDLKETSLKASSSLYQPRTASDCLRFPTDSVKSRADQWDTDYLPKPLAVAKADWKQFFNPTTASSFRSPARKAESAPIFAGLDPNDPSSFTTSRIDKVAINGFSDAPQVELATLLSAQLASPLPDGFRVVALVSNPLHIVVLLQQAAGRHSAIFFTRPTPEYRQVDYDFSYNFAAIAAPLLDMTRQSCALHALTEAGVEAVVGGTKEHITERVIVFNGSDYAAKLYEANKWDVRALRIHALHLGLRYRQLDVIDSALKSLDIEQTLAGARTLVDHFETSHFILQDKVFARSLLECAMRFISSVMRTFASQTSIDAKERHERVGTFGDILSRLREFVFTLSASPSHAPRPAAKDQPLAPWTDSPRKSRQSVSSLQRAPSKSSLVRSLPSSGNLPLLSSAPSSPMAKPKLSTSGKGSAGDGEGQNTLLNLDSTLKAFENFDYHWGTLSDLEVVRAALESGQIGPAIAFMRFRLESTTHSAPLSKKLIELSYFTQITELLVYQSILSNDLDDAAEMLRQVNEPVGAHFYAVAKLTMRNSVRSALLAHSATRNFMADEKQLDLEKANATRRVIRWAELLETYYPHDRVGAQLEGDAKIQHEGATTSLPTHRHEAMFNTYEVDDIQSGRLDIGVDLRFGAQSDVKESTVVLLQKGRDLEVTVGGYSQFRLKWLYNWDEHSIYRVLLEAFVAAGLDLAQLDSYFPKEYILSQIKYFADHFDWISLDKWVRSLDISSLSLTLEGHLKEQPHKSAVMPPLDKLLAAIDDAAKTSSPLIAAMLRCALAERGLLLFGKSLKQRLDTNFDEIIRLLAGTGRLFGRADLGSKTSLPLAELQPRKVLSEFHRHAIRYFVVRQDLGMLVHYLDAFRLASTKESVEELETFLRSLLGNASASAAMRSQFTQLMLLLALRSRVDFHRIALLNARINVDAKLSPDETEDKGSFNTNDFMKRISKRANHDANAAFALIFTLFYHAVPLRDAFALPPTDRNYLDQTVLKKILVQHPSLYSAFFPNESHTSDAAVPPKSGSQGSLKVSNVAVSNEATLSRNHRPDILSSTRDLNFLRLIQIHSPIDVEAVFFNSTSSDLTFPYPKIATAFASRRPTDEVDMAFYLTNGRPYLAFERFLADFNLTWAPGEPKFFQKLPVESKAAVLNVIRTTAFDRLTDDVSLCACVVLMELVGLDSEMLRVDVRAGRALMRYYLTKSEKDPSRDLSNIFMKLDYSVGAAVRSDEQVNVCQSILRALHSAAANEDQSSEDVRFPSDVEQWPVSTWSLIAAFTRIHGLERDETSLVRLARKNDWVGFLLEAQCLRYPTAQIIHIASESFGAPALKRNVYVALKSSSAEQVDDMDEGRAFLASVSLDADHNGKLFQMLRFAQGQRDAPSALIELCTRLRYPMLSVLAATLDSSEKPEASQLKCVCAFLYASYDGRDWFDMGADEQFAGDSTVAVMSGLQSNAFKVASDIIVVLARAKKHVHMLRAFDIFAPQHPCVSLIKALKAADLYQYNEAASCISKFNSELSSAGVSSWVMSLTLRLADELLHSTTGEYEKTHLIELLARSEWHPKYKKLLDLYTILKETSLAAELYEWDEIPSSETLIQLLLDNRAYEEARTLVKRNKWDAAYIDAITKAEVVALIDASRSELFAHEPQNNVWRLGSEMFLKNSCTPSFVASFFVQEYESLLDAFDELSAFDAPVVRELTAKLSTLLEISVTWFERDGSIDRSQLIAQLKENMLRLKVEGEIKLLSGGVKSRASSAASTPIAPRIRGSYEFPTERDSPQLIKSPIKTPAIEMRADSPYSTAMRQRNAQLIAAKSPEEFVSSFGIKKKLAFSPNDQEEDDGDENAANSSESDEGEFRPKSYSAELAALETTEQPLNPDSEAAKVDSDLLSVEDPVTQRALDVIIGRLLNESKLADAIAVCKMYNHVSIDVLVVDTMLAIALEKKIQKALHPSLQSMLSHDVDFESLDELDRLELLAHMCLHAKGCAVQIYLQKKVALMLDMSFEQVKNNDPYQILQHLFIDGLVNLDLVRQYIASLKLDSQRVADVLAQHCFSSILDAYLDERMVVPEKPPNTATAVWSPKGLRSRATPLQSPSRSGALPIGLWSPSRSPMKIQKAPDTPGTPVATKENITKTSREFIEYVSIADRPEYVGNCLIQLLQKYCEENAISPESEPAKLETFNRFEVEMFVHAHFCYLISSNMEGIEKVLGLIRARIPRYVRLKQFKLLVRLLTGTKQCEFFIFKYSRLQYCLDLLIQYDCFEMVLSKNVVMDEVGKRELQRALYQFLKTNYPNNEMQMKLVLLHFGMFREYAERLQEYATKKLDSLKGLKTTQLASVLHRCLSAMDSFLDAAENFQKSNSYSLAGDCFNKAALMGLQIDHPDTTFIHLTKAEARQLMMYTGSFEQALVIANAYDLNAVSEWVAPIYHQAIVEGNLDFFCDFAGFVPFTSQLYVDLAKRWRTMDSRKKSQIENIKTLLGYLPDHYMRFSLFHELAKGNKDFDDALNALKHTPGLLDRLEHNSVPPK